MRAMGRNPTEDEIMQIMNEIDVDHNGNKNWISYIHCIVLIIIYLITTFFYKITTSKLSIFR